MFDGRVDAIPKGAVRLVGEQFCCVAAIVGGIQESESADAVKFG